MNDAPPLSSLDDDDLPAPSRFARWLAGRGVDYADRQRVNEQLFLQDERSRVGRFAVLMALSVVIATVGLLLDSTAVVIGAMLLAPLMTPVLGFAAALTMNWTGRMATSFALVAFGAAGAVALAWLVTVVAPLATTVLPDEVTSRTSPSTGDLIIALAAGAAGAVALIREDVSAALPGVAIAVALVPPLGVVGITLGVGQSDLAFEAMLLFTANIVAIVLAAAIVFLAGGFVPHAHLTRSRPRIIGYLTLVVAAVALIAAPLRVTVQRLVDEAALNAAIDDDIETWLAGSGLDVANLEIEDDLVRVDVVGPTPPPMASRLAELVEKDVGDGVAIEVRWIEEQLDRISTG